ncbi:MAG: large conductance mechanosensitive channel protein MscL [Oscillospiraceae bacterium]|nr:large conductance mechanosensitive channel protein MscL [Oscillospiraceae bacterium]
MKGFMNEFKTFIAKGNVMNLAVGVIIGAAFQAITTSLVNDIISPFLGLFTPTDMSGWTFMVGQAEIRYGAFLTAILNFFVMAFVVFLLVRFVNKLMDLGKKPAVEEAPVAPTTKKCPFCCSEIAIEATRCPHCTSEVK